jgi:hypothetical protein
MGLAPKEGKDEERRRPALLSSPCGGGGKTIGVKVRAAGGHRTGLRPIKKDTG